MSNPLLRNLIPHNARRKGYRPKIGDRISLSLPGEIVQAVVTEEYSNDSCEAQILGAMARTHQYKAKDKVPVMREFDEFLGTERWAVVSDRDLHLAEVSYRFKLEEQARLAREAEARRATEEVPEPPLPDGNWSA